MRGLLLLLVGVILVEGRPAHAWGNLDNHWRLAEESRLRVDASGRLDRFFRGELGLEDGKNSSLAIQLGFPDASAIDDDIRTRLTKNVNRDLLLRKEKDLDEISRIAVELNDGPPCPRTSALTPCLAQKARFPIDQWLRLGTSAEDNPNPRAKHHFHDPVQEHAPPSGNHGLDNSAEVLAGLDALLVETLTVALRGGSLLQAVGGIFLFPLRSFTDLDLGNFDFEGRSAVDRALNTPRDEGFPSERYPENLFALPDAERYLYLALTRPYEDEREHYLALHVLAVGHVLHLLQDMGSVAHARNDFALDHLLLAKLPGLTSLEQSAENDGLDPAVPESVLAAALEAPAFSSAPYKFLARETGSGFPLGRYESVVAPPLVEGYDVADLWDEPPFGAPSGRGLAEFVNTHFFSAGSIGNYATPTVASCGDPAASDGPEDGPSWVAELPTRDLLGHPLAEPGSFVTSSLVPHLTRCTLHCTRFAGQGPKPVRPWCATVLDESVQRDYLELLWPQVIHYGERFLDLYWSPRLEVIPIAPAAGSTQGRFRLANRALLELRFEGDAAEIVYETMDASTGLLRRVVAPAACGSGGSLSLGPAPGDEEAGPPGDFVCELPTSLPEPPASPGSFWVVVRGALGGRGASASPDEFEAGDQEFVVAFDRVLPTLVFDRIDGQHLGAPPDTDVPRKRDLYAIEIDPLRPLEEGEAGPAALNLTNVLRVAAARPDLDFGAPAVNPAQPGEIALRSDRESVPGSSETFDDILAPLDVFLMDLGTQEAAGLQSIPASRLDEVFRLSAVVPRWAADGSALFFYSDFAESDTNADLDQLNRQVRPSGPVEAFAEGEKALAASDPRPAAGLPAGTEREACRLELGHPLVGPISASRLVVSARCQKEQVVVESSQTYWSQASFAPVYKLRIMDVTASAGEPGKLDGVFTHRFDVAADGSGGEVHACGGVTGCWEDGADSPAEFVDEGAPAFSPDGTQVAFGRDPEFLNPANDVSLYVADLVTGQIRLVASFGPGVLDGESLAWSPDGRWLAFHLTETHDVYVIPTDSEELEEPRRMTRDADVATSFGWLAPLQLPVGP